MTTGEISARALGFLSVSMGLAQIVAPQTVSRLMGVRDGRATAGVMRVVGLREIAAGVGLLTQRRPAPWQWTRVAGDAMDLMLLAAALVTGGKRLERRERLAAALAAIGALAVADLQSAEQLSEAADGDEDSLRVKNAITINRTPEEVYRLWRDFTTFPRFMNRVVSVTVTGPRTSHWVARGPGGKSAEWDAEIIDDRPNQFIAWQALPGSEVHHRGSVRLAPAPGGRGTEVRVQIRYVPPAGPLGAALARVLGEAPPHQAQTDLRKVKQILEAGEVIYSEATLLGEHAPQRPAQPPATRREALAR